jgi:2-keto-4-pentenoate hydratase/2-oxohepta-3-ene-1,7-dioic acid hydratase in catechol pathway
MKIVRFSTTGKTCYGILDSDKIQACTGTPYRCLKPTDSYYRTRDVKILSPCTPSKIVALGVNYRSHGEEMSY